MGFGDSGFRLHRAARAALPPGLTYRVPGREREREAVQSRVLRCFTSTAVPGERSLLQKAVDF